MFGKKKDTSGKPRKKKSSLDKLVMGAIVGGAVGSVIGMSIAPNTGKDTREILVQKGRGIYEKGKDLGGKIQEQIQDKVRPSEKKMLSGGLLSRIGRRLFRPKNKNAPLNLNEEEMREIPHEK